MVFPDVESGLGQLREWLPSAGREGCFLIISVDKFIVYAVKQDGRCEGFYREYLERYSHVISHP